MFPNFYWESSTSSIRNGVIVDASKVALDYKDMKRITVFEENNKGLLNPLLMKIRFHIMVVNYLQISGRQINKANVSRWNIFIAYSIAGTGTYIDMVGLVSQKRKKCITSRRQYVIRINATRAK